MKRVQAQKGFTIVELLIVVVVIAILAAITIVAYNGIQNRAKASAAQSAVSQVSKKIMAYAIQNGDQYPPNLATAGITNTTGLEYSYNNSVTPKTYGVTATNGKFSYYISNTSPQPAAGGYPGHGVNGVAAITNLVPNPSFEGGATGWTASSNITQSPQATGGLYGDRFHRGTRTSGAAIGLYTAKFSIDANETYTARLSARYPATQQAFLRFQWFDSTGASIGSNTDPAGSISSNVNSWQTLTYTYAAPANATSSRLDIVLTTVGGAAAGDVLDLDGVMVVKGSTTGGYADGNTAGWVWNDTANANTASSSTGPPQP